MKKLICILATLLLPGSAMAANITVPTAPGANYFLISTASGAYSPATSFSLNSLGISSTTPWASLGIASSTYNFLQPLFAISTSTDYFGQLFGVRASSTTLLLKSRASASNANIQNDSGARAWVGHYEYLGGGLDSLDQLQVNGRINEGSWHFLKCYPAMINTALLSSDTPADGSTFCGDFSYQEDNTGTANVNSENGTQYLRLNFGAVANDGSMLYTGTQNGLTFDIASTTPVMETVARIGQPQNASSSNFFIGFTSIVPLNTDMELRGGTGCFFNASTTQADWWATCSTGTATTTADTGFASSTNLTATGSFYLFRMEVSSNRVDFYMGSAATTTRKVASITTNIPTGATQLTSPQVVVTRTNAFANAFFDVASVRLWIRSLGAFGF